MNAVGLYQQGTKSAAAICRDLDIPEGTFRQWVHKFKSEGAGSFVGSGKIKPANEEVYRLRKELEYDLWIYAKICQSI